MEAKYLKITIHDNDFTGYAHILANAIQSMLHWLCWVPATNEDLEKLKPAVANIWNGMAMMVDVEHDYIITRNYSNYINEHLELSIVDFADIPQNGTYEDMYIPLFEFDINED